MESAKKINIVIADDHTLFRKGLRNLMLELDSVGEIFEAQNGAELLELLNIAKPLPDVVLLDINMPVMDGVEATKKIKQLFPGLKIIILTMENNEHFVLQMLELGVNGYLIKNCEPEELALALESVTTKDFYFDDNITDFIRKVYFTQKGTGQKQEEPTHLTTREKEILQLICMEMNTYEIAEKLFLSPRTVESHRKNIIEKTGVKNIAGLIVYAIKNNLVEI